MSIIVKKFAGSANSYLIGDILIDAPLGVFGLSGIAAATCIITHEHCDHFCGMGRLGKDVEIAASPLCAEVINRKDNSLGLCSLFSVPFPNRKITRLVKENDIVHGDGVSLRVLETPGHAKGALCLYEEEQKLLFSGDTVFPGFSIPRTNLPASEPEKLAGSYEKLTALEIKKIFPGHGESIEEPGYIRKLLCALSDR